MSTKRNTKYSIVGAISPVNQDIYLTSACQATHTWSGLHSINKTNCRNKLIQISLSTATKKSLKFLLLFTLNQSLSSHHPSVSHSGLCLCVCLSVCLPLTHAQMHYIWAYAYRHTHTDTGTHSQTYKHTHRHTHTHKNTHREARVRTHTHTHTHTCTHSHTCIHTNTHTHTLPHI